MIEIVTGKRLLRKYNSFYAIAEEVSPTGIQSRMPYKWIQGKKVVDATTTFLVEIPPKARIAYTIIQVILGIGRIREQFVITRNDDVDMELVLKEHDFVLIKGNCEIEPVIADMDRYEINEVKKTRTKIFRRVTNE